MENRARWEIAQRYEKDYWKNIADKIAADSQEQLTWYQWKAAEFEKKLQAINFDRGKPCRILEVGSGPMGIVSYLTWGERFALDPLEKFYRENETLVALRNGSVNYIAGGGEEIPFPDGYFSIIIIDNVLDHVCAPHRVMSEISRVLSGDGLLYLELNTYTSWGRILHDVLAKLTIDKGHPYSYTAGSVREFLGKHRFEVKAERVNDYREAREMYRKSASMKAKIKGYTGLSEFIYYALCSKKAREKGTPAYE